MKLRELLAIIDSHFIIELQEGKETFEVKREVPEELKDCEVRKIEAVDNILIIILDNSKKAPASEELGYSFEIGI